MRQLIQLLRAAAVVAVLTALLRPSSSSSSSSSTPPFPSSSSLWSPSSRHLALSPLPRLRPGPKPRPRPPQQRRLPLSSERSRRELAGRVNANAMAPSAVARANAMTTKRVGLAPRRKRLAVGRSTNEDAEERNWNGRRAGRAPQLHSSQEAMEIVAAHGDGGVDGDDHHQGESASDELAEEPPSKPQDALSGYWVQRGLLLFVAILWGTNFPSVKYLLSENVTPDVICAARFLIAGLALTPFVSKGVSKEVTKAGVEIGFWISLGYISQAISLQSVSSNKAAFVCSLQVMVVPVVELFLGKKLSAKLVVASLLSFIGVGVLELGPDASLAPPDVNDLICFLQPLTFGISYVRIAKYLEDLKSEPNVASKLSAVQVQTTAVVSLVWALALGLQNGMGLDTETIAQPYVSLALLHTGLLSTALTVFITNVALKEVPASESSVIIGTEPLWAALFAVQLLGEQLTEADIVGGALILAGCFLGTQSQQTTQE